MEIRQATACHGGFKNVDLMYSCFWKASWQAETCLSPLSLYGQAASPMKLMKFFASSPETKFHVPCWQGWWKHTTYYPHTHILPVTCCCRCFCPFGWPGEANIPGNCRLPQPELQTVPGPKLFLSFFSVLPWAKHLAFLGTTVELCICSSLRA